MDSDAQTDDDSDDVVHESTAEQINIAIVQKMDEQEDTEDSSGVFFMQTLNWSLPKRWEFGHLRERVRSETSRSKKTAK